MMQRYRWIQPEKARYYQVDLLQDLLGDWTLVKCWGGIESRMGGMRILVVASEEAGQAQIEKIAKRRHQHGYVELSGDAGEEAALLGRPRTAAVSASSRQTDHGEGDLFHRPNPLGPTPKGPRPEIPFPRSPPRSSDRPASGVQPAAGRR